MPRADAEQLAAWEAMRLAVARAEAEIQRRLEEQRDQELAHFRVLATLVNAGGQLRMHELADELVMGRPTASRVCDRMQRLGLVERERSREDGRAVFLKLTKLGRNELRRCKPAYERFVHEVFARYLFENDFWALNRVSDRLPQA